MDIKLTGAGGKKARSGVKVSDQAFGCSFNEPLVHQVVTAYLSGARAGTRAQKTRSGVRGGGAKPWRQKGTGNARAGTIRSPLWRGGGKVFAAVPRDYGQKVNRKMFRAAMRSIVSELVRQERLIVVEEFAVDEPKTRLVVEKLNALGVGNVLLVVDGAGEALSLAVRNLPHIGLIGSAEIDPVSLLRFEKVLITGDALKKLEERLA